MKPQTDFEWFPINSAPKNGDEVFVRANKGTYASHYVAYFADEKWVVFGGMNVMCTCEPNEWTPIFGDQVAPSA